MSKIGRGFIGGCVFIFRQLQVGPLSCEIWVAMPSFSSTLGFMRVEYIDTDLHRCKNRDFDLCKNHLCLCEIMSAEKETKEKVRDNVFSEHFRATTTEVDVVGILPMDMCSCEVEHRGRRCTPEGGGKMNGSCGS
ncbi:hypothetical protein L6452_42981 [Arctium lappa]|uniref:Uncharacterized protein n=1 Tax=Arctium lappa TaxID=4217 RepID=A0ACB8XKX3_ARCLA|nr:hypothetical protein L6452_42981 [Arctium lappa]